MPHALDSRQAYVKRVLSLNPLLWVSFSFPLMPTMAHVHLKLIIYNLLNLFLEQSVCGFRVIEHNMDIFLHNCQENDYHSLLLSFVVVERSYNTQG
jgi:hypothetical protein